jgi:hypothetical protein
MRSPCKAETYEVQERRNGMNDEKSGEGVAGA